MKLETQLLLNETDFHHWGNNYAWINIAPPEIYPVIVVSVYHEDRNPIYKYIYQLDFLHYG